MIIKSLKGLKFKDNIGTYEFLGRQYALYEPEKGFISLDGEKIYTPIGGKNALAIILETGFCGEVFYIQPLN